MVSFCKNLASVYSPQTYASHFSKGKMWFESEGNKVREESRAGQALAADLQPRDRNCKVGGRRAAVAPTFASASWKDSECAWVQPESRTYLFFVFFKWETSDLLTLSFYLISSIHMAHYLKEECTELGAPSYYFLRVPATRRSCLCLLVSFFIFGAGD